MKWYEMPPGPAREAAKSKGDRRRLEYVGREGAVTEWRNETNRRFFRHVAGGPFVRMDGNFRDVFRWLALLGLPRTPTMRLTRVSDGRIIVANADTSRSRVVGDMESFAHAHVALFPEEYRE